MFVMLHGHTICRVTAFSVDVDNWTRLNVTSAYFTLVLTMSLFATFDPPSSGGSTLGQGGTGPPNLAQPPPPPQFLDTVVLLLVELIGSIVNFAYPLLPPKWWGARPPKYFFLEPPLPPRSVIFWSCKFSAPTTKTYDRAYWERWKRPPDKRPAKLHKTGNTQAYAQTW